MARPPECSQAVGPLLYKIPFLSHLRVIGAPRRDGTTFASFRDARLLDAFSPGAGRGRLMLYKSRLTERLRVTEEGV